MTEKIEFTKPYQATPSEKKAKPQASKQPSSSRWQEVEERRDSPKSGPIKDESNERKKERLLLKASIRQAKPDEGELSPFEMFSSFNSKALKEREPESEFSEGELDLSSIENEIGIENEEVDSARPEFKDEQDEEPSVQLSGVVPVLTAAPFQQETSLDISHATPVSSIASSTFQNVKLLAFAEKLVKKITVMKSEGKTEITLTLKNLTVFNGGILKVTEHDSAKGQYNLVFTNLNSKAHALVTSNYAERLLKESLEAKGFSFHMITATTESEPIRSYASNSHEDRDTRDNEKDPERDEESA